MSSNRAHRAATTEDTAATPDVLVGRGVSFSGQLAGASRIRVAGEMDATLTRGQLDVVDSGVVLARADVDGARVAGRFEGSLWVRGSLHVAATGVVRGTVSCADLVVAAGGRITGDIAVEPAGPGHADSESGGEPRTSAPDGRDASPPVPA